jgi:diguanylate cyclase (GGDEF)-like protein/PAS domain S-box-containing protein
MYSTNNPAVPLRWARAAYVGVPFIAPAIYHFTVEFLRIARKRRVAVVAAWICALVFSVIGVGTDLLVTRVQKYWWGYYPRYGAISVPFLLFFFGFLAGSLLEFVSAWPRARDSERVRIRLLMAGFGIAYIGCVDYLAKYGIPVYPFGYIPILIFLVIVAHTVRKYDLVPITPSLAAGQIIRTMADALLVCDVHGRIELANESAEELLGFEKDELLAKRIADVIESGSGKHALALLSGGTAHDVECVFRSRDGEHLAVNLSVAPLEHDGKSAGAVLIARDIRERKRADRDIRRAMSLLQSTLDSTADGILVIGDGGRIASYNRRFADLWRIPDSVLERGDDRSILDCMLEQIEEPDEFQRIVESLYANPDAESFDLIRFRDGRSFERYSIGRRIAGVGTIRVWSFRDVTERQRNESALAESEARFRLLFEQNAAGVCRKDMSGRILESNETFARILGYTRHELLGLTDTDLYVRPSEAAELTEILRHAHTLQSVEIEMLRRNGESVWVLMNLVLVGEGRDAIVHATAVDIHDRKRAEEQIEFHAYHDVLTGLPNRKLFTDRLNWALSRCRRSGHPLAVMFMDLDHFKTINDTLGHTAGDELLLEMARRLQACVREDDMVARLGGDEFTIVLSDLREPEDALAVAQKILASIEEPLSIGDMAIYVTASIGIAIYPNDGADPETLLKNADTALYRAKDAGRNTYQLCTDDMKERAVQRLLMERTLRRALNESELELYYQPVISLATGRIVAVEALLRWNDPERGIVHPNAFVPFAEDSRLIMPIGHWVLRTACQQAQEWQSRGGAPLRVAVNLSARQFQHRDLVRNVASALDSTGLDPSLLELEITETTAMQNADVSLNVLNDLRRLGVAIAIDDFGTGYSSLNYLKRFAINAVKIDRAFVRELGTSEEDAAIVSAVIAIARSLRLRVIAEGVETHEQLSILRKKHCDEVQGFLFGPAVPADALVAMLDDGRPRIPIRVGA